MKRAITAGIGALALAAMTLPTAAADLGARPIAKAPVAAPVAVYNWSGFYFGGHVGGISSDKDWSDATGIPPLTALGGHTATGFLAGGQLGFNWQLGAWVLGIEGQASWTDASGSHVCDPTTIPVTVCSTDINWVATVAGRVGYAFNNLLLYAKGGVAFADDDHAIIFPGIAALVASKTRTGWMVGAGFEYGFTPNWSAKIEYNFMDFQDLRLVTVGGFPLADIEQQAHVVKAGINYRFTWGPVY